MSNELFEKDINSEIKKLEQVVTNMQISDPLFERLRKFTDEANQTNSILDKVKVIEKYPDLKDLFVYVYDTINFTYGITSANIKKLKHLGCLPENMHYGIFTALGLLNSRTSTGHEAVKLVNTLIRDYPEYEDLIYNILDRNLKTRTDSKLINKVWPGLIPEFNVALAEDYEDKMKIDFSKVKYYASRKCDGVRLLTLIDNEGDIKLISRQGKEFETLEVLKGEIRKLGLRGWVLDGEICIVDENGNENFQGVMKEIRKKDHQIQRPVYMLFDMIPLDDFKQEYYVLEFSKRLRELNSSMNFRNFTSPNLKVLDQNLVTSNDDLAFLKTEAAILKWEGLILRKADSPYEGKRSKNLLKVKAFIDAEYKVKDIEIGPIRHFIDGKETTSEMLSNIIIEHKGNTVGVGSGFTMEQRLYYKDHPEELLGKVVTIKYFEETKNQDGSYSLRFPTVKAIHGNERNT